MPDDLWERTGRMELRDHLADNPEWQRIQRRAGIMPDYGIELEFHPNGGAASYASAFSIIRARGYQAFVAEITGRDPTYRYQRRFFGQRGGFGGRGRTVNNALEVRIDHLRAPMLLDIRAAQRGYWALYPGPLPEETPQLAQIDEPTLNQLLDCKLQADADERANRLQAELLARRDRYLAEEREREERTRAIRQEENRRAMAERLRAAHPLISRSFDTTVVVGDWDDPPPLRPPKKREPKKIPIPQPIRRKFNWDE